MGALNIIIDFLADIDYKNLKKTDNFQSMKTACQAPGSYQYYPYQKLEFKFDICWFRSIILMIKYSDIFKNIYAYRIVKEKYTSWSSLDKWTCFINRDLFPTNIYEKTSNMFDFYLAEFLIEDLKTIPSIKLVFPFFKYLCSQEIFTSTIPTFEIWEYPLPIGQTPEIIFVKYKAFDGNVKYTLNTHYKLNGMIIMNYNLFKLRKPFSHHYMYIHYNHTSKVWKSFESTNNGSFFILNVAVNGSFTNSFFNQDLNLKYNINKGSRLCMYVKTPHPINKIDFNKVFQNKYLYKYSITISTINNQLKNTTALFNNYTIPEIKEALIDELSKVVLEKQKKDITDRIIINVQYADIFYKSYFYNNEFQTGGMRRVLLKRI